MPGLPGSYRLFPVVSGPRAESVLTLAVPGTPIAVVAEPENGYWQDPVLTAARWRAAPAQAPVLAYVLIAVRPSRAGICLG
jgi:hypothetical protein